MWAAIIAIAAVLAAAIPVIYNVWLSKSAKKRQLTDSIHALESKRDELEQQYDAAVKTNEWDTANTLDNQLSGVSAEISLKYSILDKDYR